MRGRTFKNAFIIADEMQNSSPNQMKMALTRIGEGSKMVITGDLNQSDRVGENGLSDFVFKLKNSGEDLLEEIAYIELGRTDIRRSSVVSKIINIYEPVVSKKETSIELFDGFNEYDVEKNQIDSDAAMIPKKDYKF
jgi:phosphate starvation-inducible protein PhoH